jgi:hypothetical protein
MPIVRPNAIHTITAPTVSEIVAGRLSKIWSRTSWLLT